MSSSLRRSCEEPIRRGLSRTEEWDGPDCGLIYCWERGRQMRFQESDLAVRAEQGELVPLPWKGGTHNLDEVKEDGAKQKRFGSLRYLAMWQGLRGNDLEIAIEAETVIVCSRAKRAVIFRANIPVPE